MKFGHRGLNHPVREIATGRIDFTSQNHGYAVDEATIDPEKLLVTHVEVNDGTVEGVRHRDYPALLCNITQMRLQDRTMVFIYLTNLWN